MINKLNRLSSWLKRNGLKVESSMVSDMFLKLGTSIPEELRGLYSNEELNLPANHPNSSAPTLEELRKLFTPEELNDPLALEELRKLFTPEELSLSSKESLKHNILNERGVLRKGARDDSSDGLVREVQTLLEKHGHTLPGHGADGIFGGETEKAILEFQRNNKNSGLRESGEIDAATLIVLQSEVAITREEAELAEGDSKNPDTTMPAPKVSGRAGRSQLAGMSSETRDKLYKLTQAEVGSQGSRAQQAFMETVANRSAIQGKTIDFTVSDRRYYEPIMGEGKSINTLRAVNDATRAKYDEILNKVIGGSNITNGATHNASAGVAKKVNEGGYNANTSSIIVIGGETFYSKTYEQKKIKGLDVSISSSGQSDVPPARRPKTAGEYVLPKISFVSVPCVSAANLAIKEAREQWDNGNIGETDPRAEPLIQKYFGWTSRNSSWSRNVDRWGTGRRTFGKHKGKRQMNPIKGRHENGSAQFYAWSAAYVSWVMGQYDGEGAKWYVLEGHAGYIRAFKNKRAKIEKNPEDHIGKMYYMWFTREEMNKYGMKPELGDVIGRGSHCDIYIGNNQLIGGNTVAKNENTGNKRKYNGGTSGAKPLVWKSGFGIIKRVKITGPSKEELVA